jgi:hypothetical protein
VLRYAAGSARYRLESQTRSVQEMMGNTQTLDVNLTLLFSASFVPDAGNLAATFTVDSIAADGAAAGQVGVTRGKTYHAVFTPRGEPVSLTTPDSADAVVTQIGELFRDVLPMLPLGAPTAGSSWTDTTARTANPAPGIQLRTRAVRDHRVVGWEALDGARALRMSTAGRYEVSGEGEQMGQALQFSGSGSGSTDHYVSPAGALLRVVTADSSAMTVTVISMGMDIPVRQTRRATLTRLP